MQYTKRREVLKADALGFKTGTGPGPARAREDHVGIARRQLVGGAGHGRVIHNGLFEGIGLVVVQSPVQESLHVKACCSPGEVDRAESLLVLRLVTSCGRYSTCRWKVASRSERKRSPG